MSFLTRRGLFSRVILALLTTGLFPVTWSAASAATWFVSPTGSPDGAGISWASARSHPSQAAATAKPGDEIWVAVGVYSGVPIRLPAGVRLLGGFAGGELQADARSTNAALTVLETTDAFPVIEVVADPATAEFTLVSGVALQAAAEAAATGRGLVAFGGRLEVSNCVFRNFKAPTTFEEPGAALFTTNSALTLVDSKFLNNRTTGNASYGAAVGCVAVDPCIIRGNSFRDNRAVASSVMKLNGCRGEIADNVFVNNQLVGDSIPGAVELYRSTFAVVRNRFLFNRKGCGAALFIFDSLGGQTNRIAFNLFAGNTSQDGPFPQGALSLVSGAKAQVLNNTFAGNVETATSGMLAKAGPIGTDDTSQVIANNLFLGHTKGNRFESFPAAARNVFLDFGEAARVSLEAIGRPEGLVDDEVVGGLRSLDFRLRPSALSRGYGDPSFVPADAQDLLGRPAVHADGSVDAGAIAFEPLTGATLLPRIVYLRPDGDDTADGDSWQTAMRSLQAAASRADFVRPIELWLAAGSYDGNTGPDGLPPSVTIRGSFAGHETDADQRSRPLQLTTELTRSSTNVLIGLYGNGPWNEIEGVVLNGAGASRENRNWGGFVAVASWPHIHQCRFEGHYGRAAGVALFADGGLIEDCQFVGNSRTNSNVIDCGGVVHLRGSAPVSVFRRNLLVGNQHLGSRAALCWFGPPTIVSHNAWISNYTGTNSLGVVASATGVGINPAGHGFWHNTWVDNVDDSALPSVFQFVTSGQTLQFAGNLAAFNRGHVRLSPNAALSARDNLVFANGPGSAGAPLPATNANISVDPRLAADRWHLAPDSPARNAVQFPRGEGFQTDLDGEGAWLGTAPDIGADETLPDHPLAATVASAVLVSGRLPGTFSGIFRDWEDTCPDCHLREFAVVDGNFTLQLSPQGPCPKLPCTGQLHPADYPFDLGASAPGSRPLRVLADDVALRTLSLWVQPPVSGRLSIRKGTTGPAVVALTHPGILTRLEASTNLLAWEGVDPAAVSQWIAARTNENGFFRLFPR